MLKVISKVRAREGCMAALLEEAEKLVAATRREDFNHGYELWEAANEDRTIIFDEVWESVDAWRKHVETPHLKAFKETTADMIEASDTTPAHPKAVA